MTDDDTKDALICKNGIEKTIRAVYAQKKVYFYLSVEVARTDFFMSYQLFFFSFWNILLFFRGSIQMGMWMVNCTKQWEKNSGMLLKKSKLNLNKCVIYLFHQIRKITSTQFMSSLTISCWLMQTMGKKTSGSKSGHVARKSYVTKLEQVSFLHAFIFLFFAHGVEVFFANHYVMWSFFQSNIFVSFCSLVLILLWQSLCYVI